MEKKIVDARGLACPLPVVNAKKAVEEVTGEGTVTVQVDNAIAVQNLQKFAKQRKLVSSSVQHSENEYEVTIQVSREGSKAADEMPISNSLIQKGQIVVLSSNEMGNGEEKLGKALMKAFVFALTKQDSLPETILCYNSGAYLSCEGSDTLEDLKYLASEGVHIMTCGTCLDFYGLKETLGVGTVTNMYEIVETMQQAKTTIRP